MLRVISLGWGRESFSLAAMAALGEIEPVNAAIFADTTHEKATTYAFAERWAPWLESHGVTVVTVTARPDELELGEESVVDIPAFTFSNQGKGQIRRQCTLDWKISPIRRWLQSHREKQKVELWIGISLSEAARMKPSDVKYVSNRWPLIERRMTRNDCSRWLQAHGLEIPSKSACVFCPYQNMAAWQDLKANGNGDWEKAIEVDRAIRKARPPYDLFVHPARIPLEEVDLRTPQEHGQMELWNEECTGICGV